MQVLVSGLVLQRKGKDAQAFFEVIELVSGGWRSFRSAQEEGATRVELEPFGNNYELPAFHAHRQTPPGNATLHRVKDRVVNVSDTFAILFNRFVCQTVGPLWHELLLQDRVSGNVG